MREAPLPIDEASRLRELQSFEILDTSPLPSLDGLTILATQILATPFALISLVDAKRECFVSLSGFEPGAIETREVPRANCFGAHAILEPRVLVASDASADGRFVDSSLVAGAPGIRFCAAAPLITSNGYAIGALCVADVRPRPSGLTESERSSLDVLARQIVQVLEQLRRLRQLQREQEEQKKVEQILTEKEAQYRRLVENTTDIIYRTNPEGWFTFVNATAVREMQYTEESLLNIRFTDLIRPDARAEAERFYRKQAFRRTPSTYYEFPALRKDGSQIWFGQHVHILLENGVVTGFQAIARDITDRKRAEDQLRESRQQVHALLEATNDIVQRLSPDGRFLYTNRAWHEALGYTPEERSSMTVFDVIHPDSRDYCHAIMSRLMVGEVVNNIELSFLAKDGSRVDVAGTANCEMASGQPVATRSFFHNVTQRRKAEEGLRESEARLRQVVESSPNGIAIIDENEIITMANASMERMFGYSRTDLIGQPVELLAPEHLRPALARQWLRRLDNPEDNEESAGAEFMGRRRDASEFPVDLSLTPIESGGGPHVLATFVDVKDRKRAEDALKNMNVELERRVLHRTAELEEAYRQLNFHIENTPLGMVQWAPDLRILHWSRQAERIFGWTATQVEGKTIDDWPFISTRDREAVRGIMLRLIRAQDRRKVHRVLQLARDGRELHCVWHTSVMLGQDGQVKSMMALIQDLTEQVRLEQQFHQAQKMEAVGRLAGGIAHDFNNLLTVINGYGDMILQDPTAPASVKKSAEQILYAGERAAGLTNQLLAFSRQQVLHPIRLPINAKLLELQKLLRRLIGEDIELSLSLDASPDSILVDPGQIDQIVMNLAVNARDAMPSGGRLTLETRNLQLDKPLTTPHGSILIPGAYVTLVVRDTGVGIDERTLRRMFEPFFTTKGTGKGTGLGLATVHGIMQQTGGTVTASSRVGAGAVFVLYFPAEEISAPIFESSTPEWPISKGSETVLLVEDEPLVRSFAREVLSEAGYNVLEVRTAEEAMFLSNGYEDTIHLLLTDVVLPAGRGTVLAEELGQKRPDMHILLMSGYVDQNPADTAVAARLPFLPKPFTREMLLQRVRETLDSGNAGTNAQLPLVF